MDLIDLLERHAVALGIGLLIGLERGWKAREDAPGSRTAGIRTFMLIGLLGGLSGALAAAAGFSQGQGGAILLGLLFAAFAAIFAVFCLRENRADKNFSATTTVSGLIAFGLGAYALVGDLRIAAATGVAVTIILASRESIHEWLRHITWVELRSGLILLAMTFIALPLFPAGAIEWLGGISLRDVWLIVIILAAVSFLGYVSVKYLGATHGTLLAAAAGGLVSSTAVTLAQARRAAGGEAGALAAGGVAVAMAVSLVRTAVLAGALNPALLPTIAVPFAAAAIVAAAAAVLLAARLRGRHDDEAGETLRNPLQLRSVFGFAVFLTVILAAGRFVADRYGAQGVLIGALAVGFADLDTVTVAMARLAEHSLSAAGAGYAVLAAAGANTLTKAAIAIVAGGGRFALYVIVTEAAALVAAGAAILIGWPAG